MHEIKFPIILILSLLINLQLKADGGMYPVSMIDKLPLKSAGLKISVSDIYNSKGEGLLTAVVQIGGCTGSFVSAKGLIITNHHCAFGGLEPYSSPENNLLEKGYLAENHLKELPIKGLTCKIMESYKDVSSQVLDGIDAIKDPLQKKTVIINNINNLKQAELLKHPDLQIEVSEMLPGKNYVIFRYKLIKDLRIVYIPARNIGEFGGETDNWEWPRHTGDFSFVRAYVDKNGKPATFDSSNVPYEPVEYLNIDAAGVKEKDFVFIVGYPGRTYRHQPAAFINYQQNYLLPFISQLYEWEILETKQIGQNDKKWLITQEPRMKSLANTMKNYQGKIKTLEDLSLYNKKIEEEKNLITKFSANLQKQNKLKDILTEYNSVYSKQNSTILKYIWYGQLLNDNNVLKIANLVDQYRERSSAYSKDKVKLEELRKSAKAQLRTYYNSMYVRWDTAFLQHMVRIAKDFQGENKITSLQSLEGYQLSSTHLLDSNYVLKLISGKPTHLNNIKDPLLTASSNFYNDFHFVDSLQSVYRAELDNLLPKYTELRMEAMNETFVPDANRTLRFTYGFIKKYEPRDAVIYTPFTTVKGMIEKNGLQSDYVLNNDLAWVYKQHEHTPFYSKELQDIPLCILYNTDTTGGNSGSPVLNEFGQLIGLNFDRTFEATVNDYAWDDKYSRSIGLDIRFVLWQTSKVAHAQYLLDEMFIDGLIK